MGESAGPGSPVTFLCPRLRRLWYAQRTRYDYDYHRVTLTGRKRRYKPPRGSGLGVRSDLWTREYRCACGHVGWSNHVDLLDLAGEERWKPGDPIPQKTSEIVWIKGFGPEEAFMAEGKKR